MSRILGSRAGNNYLPWAEHSEAGSFSHGLDHYLRSVPSNTLRVAATWWTTCTIPDVENLHHHVWGT